ncbi:MAG: response regulator transcription factor [Actinomycetota bacterium]
MTRAERQDLNGNVTGKVTLLIVDDHAAFRSFARDLVSAAGFSVAGEAEDGESALTAVESLRPDVVLLDIQLPGIDGIEVARRIADEPDAPTVVLTSTREASEFGARLSMSGARGFIPKGELTADRLTELVSNGRP